jgi:drug/metabolite transporter (DMT)-like permease
LIRLITVDTWSLLFYRSLIPGLFLLLCVIVYTRKNFFKFFFNAGKFGLLNSVFITASNIFFILALQNTNVANALVMVSLVPLIAAIISFIFLKERLDIITNTAIFLCLIAVIFIFYDSIGTDGIRKFEEFLDQGDSRFEAVIKLVSKGSILGDIFAILTAVAVAGSLVIIRSAPTKNFIPSYVMGKLGTALFASLLVSSFVIGSLDLSYIFLMIFTVGFSFIFITFAPRFISASEVGLFFLLETALGPIWVWWFISEVPSFNTIVGAIFIVLIIFLHSIYMLKKTDE